jgi:sigma54-dependent transcription regulator
MIQTKEFISARHSYHGRVNPESLVFNANLQEFSAQVSYIACLTTAGKLSAEEAHCQIQGLWQNLDRSKQQLGVGENPFNSTELN